MLPRGWGKCLENKVEGGLVSAVSPPPIPKHSRERERKINIDLSVLRRAQDAQRDERFEPADKTQTSLDFMVERMILVLSVCTELVQSVLLSACPCVL